jgi:hypothetical protein
MTKRTITRRQLIKDAAKASIGSALLMNSTISVFGQGADKSRVVLIRDKELLNSTNNPKPDIVQKMLDNAVIELLNASSVKEAWNKIIKPGDIVGIKSNVWYNLPTPDAVEKAIKKRVIEAGVAEKNISISDRGVKNDPVFQKSTALINVRPMRTHAWSGVGSLLKNYITFAENLPAYHPDSCADLAKLHKLPNVKGKTRLNILVMFTPLFHGVGRHHFNKEFTWPYKGLVVSLDPVAADSVGLQILKAKRKEYFKEDKPLNPPAKHIYLADKRHKLGNADPANIELVKLGFKEGILI